MFVLPRGYGYPKTELHVTPFPADAKDFPSLFQKPPGFVEDIWPPKQLVYLGVYLRELNCKSIVLETHYIDRDYIEDLALFYGRSLRSYPNYCQRLHFFAEEISEKEWRDRVTATDDAAREAAERLQKTYLGFVVVRPLPGAPVGRTVLRTYGPTAEGGLTRRFDAIRRYETHVGGIRLDLDGLAFQQQDRGVSACATTALWSAIQRVAPMEGLAVASPASITEAASRYLLADGRALPSEGLTLYQVCEATRAAGLAPLVVKSISPEHDRAQLLGYLSSGFAPVLAIEVVKSGEGHAVCGVGLKLGDIKPQTASNLSYRDTETSLHGVYIHDDRLGPYALASLAPYTTMVDNKPVLRTGLYIQWPDKIEAELSLLTAIVVPLPAKVRLTITRMRALGLGLADGIGKIFSQFGASTTLNCRYELATSYRASAKTFGLTPDGLYGLSCGVILSRYIGIIEISAPDGPIVDFVLDTTESGVNPAVLACVRRRTLSPADSEKLEYVATRVGTRLIQ